MTRPHPRAIINIARRLNRSVDDVMEYFEERSAIREFCGGMTRDSAERAALHDASEMEPKQ